MRRIVFLWKSTVEWLGVVPTKTIRREDGATEPDWLSVLGKNPATVAHR